MKNRYIFLSLFYLLGSGILADAGEVIKHSIDSEFLGEEREIHVRLPSGYDPESNDDYEVIFITDGEWILDTFSYLYGFCEYEKFVPPAILVGIPNTYIDGVNQRDRDFLPVHSPDFPRSGGAAHFLSFLKDELIPYIDKNYSTNREHSIYGHSFGGLFAFYCMLEEPQLFKAFYATDSPFRWNSEYLIKLASQKLKGFELEKTFWFACRESNQEYTGINILESLLETKSPGNLAWGKATYPNENHNSVKLKAIYDGLKFVYSDYSSVKGPLNFHPMKGILTSDTPIWIWVDQYPDLRYTTDGTEPNKSSKRVTPDLEIMAPSQLVIKSFSPTGRSDIVGKGEFVLGNALPSGSKPEGVESGGLNYAYYEGSLQALPVFRDLTSSKAGVVDVNIDAATFFEATNYACLFEGFFEVKEDGLYVFALSSNDGSRMFIGDKLIIDNDGIRENQEIKSFVVPLERGFYPVRIEYFSRDENSAFKLLYLCPGSRNAVLFPTECQYFIP